MNTIQKSKKSKAPREIKVIGEIIKSERTKQKISLAKLSELGFGNTNMATIISKIERGLHPNVEFMTIIKIFNALNIPIV